MESHRNSEIDFAVRYENVHKCFTRGDREFHVLQNLSEQIRLGEFIAVRGRSGSGKSTLLNLTAGIDEPTKGEIYIRDQAFSSMSRRQQAQIRREHIGFVFQFFNLIPTLTVLENVMLPAELARQTTENPRERARYLLDRIGLQDRDQDFPDRLSGGEQQRVAIARSLMMKPTLLLADEPTGNLDSKTGEEVMDLLQELQSEQGSALLMVTHSHQLALRADRVLLIQGGKLIQIDQKSVYDLA
jgi:putative ABC transport system ATP-binding protein